MTVSWKRTQPRLLLSCHEYCPAMIDTICHKVGRATLLEFKLYYQRQQSKQCRSMGRKIQQQQQKMSTPRINPCICGQVIFGKGAKNIQWGKDSFDNKGC